MVKHLPIREFIKISLTIFSALNICIMATSDFPYKVIPIRLLQNLDHFLSKSTRLKSVYIESLDTRAVSGKFL